MDSSVLNAISLLFQQVLKMQRYILEITTAVARPKSFSAEFFPGSVEALFKTEVRNLINRRNALARLVDTKVIEPQMNLSHYAGESQNAFVETQQMFIAVSRFSTVLSKAFEQQLLEKSGEPEIDERIDLEYLIIQCDVIIVEVWQVSSMFLKAQQRMIQNLSTDSS